MEQRGLTFRVFISSTFSDLVAERNALQEKVFPGLREFCQKHGARFQAIDLRWGVSEEAALDQQTLNICLEELHRCQRTSPRPNFIILLGQRYGWCPLPPQINAVEFESLLAVLPDPDRQHLKQWYRCDNNAVPAEYYLQPREGSFKEGEAWAKEEWELRTLLIGAINCIGWANTDARRLKYEASATHQEILHGALQVRDTIDHVFGFFRNIEGLPQDTRARDFLDVDQHGKPDEKAFDRLDRLKNELWTRLPNNIHNYSTKWNGTGPSTDHLQKLCTDVYNRLSKVIEEEIRKRDHSDLVDQEAIAHYAFGQDSTRHFVGREETLSKIHSYVKSDNRHPLVLHGVSGVGKSAVMAKAAQLCWPNVVARFIGATPPSCDPRSLLTDLIREISRRYGCDLTSATDYASLIEELGQRLTLATMQRPLILLVDALDQLWGANPERGLLWLPAELPGNVKLIVSTESGDSLSAILARVPEALLYEVKTMSLGEGEALLDNWLREARRTLRPEQRREVLGKFAVCPRPLYLRLAFEEARRWRSFDGIDGVVGGKRLEPDMGRILQELFSRLARPENHGSLLVARTAGALAASRDGLAEDELLDVLSDDPEVLEDFHHRFPRSPDVPRLPMVAWSRLHADLEPYLSQRTIDGLLVLSFQRGQIDHTAHELYLYGSDAIRTHERLSGYFKENGDPQGDASWTGSSRSMAQVPYHQYHARLFSQLMATLDSDQFARGLCAHFGQEVMFGALEFGLKAARELDSLKYVVSILIAWGRVLTSERANSQALIDSLLSSGHVRQAIDMILSMPPADASEGLLLKTHAVMDRGQHAIAEQLLPALLSVMGALPERTMKARLRLVDRLTVYGHWAALRLLCDPKPEDTAVRVLLFMFGTTRLNSRMAQELGEVIGKIGDPYWRGICQLVLCCRAIREDLPDAKTATEGLRGSLKACVAGKGGGELSIMAARYYRWLRLGGLRPADLADQELDRLELEDVLPETSRSVSLSLCTGHTEASFDFVPDRYERRQARHAEEFAQAIRKALGNLADCGVKWAPEHNIQQRIREELYLTAAKANSNHEDLLWRSMMPAVKQNGVNKTDGRPIDLHSLPVDRQLEVILCLLRLGRNVDVTRLFDAWSVKARTSAEQVQFFDTLTQLPPLPLTRQIIEATTERIRSALNTPPYNTLAAMVRCLLRHSMVEQSVYWLDRLRTVVAPMMTLNIDHKPQAQTPRSYMLLSLTMPPIPGDTRPEALLNAARQHAIQLAEEYPKLAELLCLEFGLRQAPLSYLADRILAFWAEDAAWGMSSDKGFSYLAGILKPTVVNDDRERFRSWFFWLLILSRAPEAAQMNVWNQTLHTTGGQRLRYEVALSHALGANDAVDICSATPSADSKLGVFAELAKVASRQLNAASPQMLAYWGDAALRFSDNVTDQAASMAFLAEASVRMGQEEAAGIYLAIAGALDEDVLPWARERMEVARFSAGVGEAGWLDTLRQWGSPGTFRECWESALNLLCEAANQQGLLALTEFLSRVPDGWGDLLAALCLTTRNSDNAGAIAGMLLERRPIIEN
jgi:hypothetical protein